MPGMPTVAGPMLKASALPKTAPTLPLPSLSHDPPVTARANGLSSFAVALPTDTVCAAAGANRAADQTATNAVPFRIAPRGRRQRAGLRFPLYNAMFAFPLPDCALLPISRYTARLGPIVKAIKRAPPTPRSRRRWRHDRLASPGIMADRRGTGERDRHLSLPSRRDRRQPAQHHDGRRRLQHD